MMETNHYKKFFIVLILFFSEIFMVCAKSNENSYIIFWDYNSNLTMDYLNSTSLSECLKNFDSYIRIDLSDFTSFNADSKTLLLKSKMNVALLKKFEEQFNKSREGKLFFTIAIDNKKILNGLNRVSLQFLIPSNYFSIDQNDYLMIYSFKKKYFRIANIYNFDEEYKNSCLDSKTVDLIKNALK